jgi:5'-AMP-activated protein kinase catalytic alpha subunit
MGVVLYYMISGCFQFQEEDNSKLFKKIIQGKFTIPMHVSTQGRELLYKLLEINPRKRINISQIKRNSWIKIYCPKEINFNGRIFDIGLNLNKYVVPIDEEIVDELSSKYNLSKVKIRISILMNKSNDYTTLYEILLNKKILEGKKSVADLKSDLFFSYIRDKKNLLKNYNNDIKKVINERKMGLEGDKNLEKIVKNELNKNKNLIKSQEDLNKINFYNNINNSDIISPKYTPKINLKDDINNNYNNRNKNILNIKFNTIIESENDFKLNSINKQKLINYNTPLLKTKKEKKFNIVNSKNSNKNEKLKRNNITSSSKRNKLNSLDKNLKSDKNVKYNINDNKIKKNIKRRKHESLDLSKTEKTKINEILNDKYNFNNKNSNNKEIGVENNNNNINNRNKLETKENQNNIENFNFKEKFKKLLSENLINNNEEKNDLYNEIKNEIHNDTNEENKENESPNNIVKEMNLVKNDVSENSKSNNYLTTDEKIKYAQTLDSFSLKNSHEDNLFNNY